METFSIDKLDNDLFEVTLNTITLDLGNNYTFEHFTRALVKALGGSLEALLDAVLTLDAPSYSNLVFTYKGNFGYHSDDIDLESLGKLLNDNLMIEG